MTLTFPALRRGAACAIAVFAALVLNACGPGEQHQTAQLPPLGATLNETSVSGISSGAYMAGQFEMAHADIVKGAAIIAGGPYGCSESIFADAMPAPGASILNATKAVNGCMLDLLGIWGVADPDALADKARRRAEEGQIGSIADVKTDRVYLFTGTQDHTVVPSIVKHAAEFYQRLGVPQENIRLVATMPAGHAFVTEREGGACERTGEPFIVDCDYDQAADLLRHIYGTLQAPSAEPKGEFITFDQRPFGASSSDGGMADTGVVYVPQECRTAQCRIHVAYHGCAQNQEKVGDAFIRESGFARWADTNRLIVLFPQTKVTAFNPQACWDWWGYTGREYLTRQAPQIKAVRAMLDALAAPRPRA